MNDRQAHHLEYPKVRRASSAYLAVFIVIHRVRAAPHHPCLNRIALCSLIQRKGANSVHCFFQKLERAGPCIWVLSIHRRRACVEIVQPRLNPCSSRPHSVLYHASLAQEAPVYYGCPYLAAWPLQWLVHPHLPSYAGIRRPTLLGCLGMVQPAHCFSSHPWAFHLHRN